MGRIHYFCAQKEEKSMELPIAIFSYRVNDLLEEVTKRTSYFGKMRGNENIPTMLDSLALTSGEDFLFNEFLEDAVSETYDWLKAFGRKIKHAVSCDIKYQDHRLLKNSGLKFTIDTKEANINEDIKINATCSVIDEASAEIDMERTSNKEWVKNHLRKYVSKEVADIIMATYNTIVLDGKQRIIDKVTVNLDGSTYDLYRLTEYGEQGEGIYISLEYDDLKLIWNGGDAVVGDMLHHYQETTVEFEVASTEKIPFTLPLWSMYDNYIFNNEVEGVDLRIKDGDSLGDIEVRAGWATVSAVESGVNVNAKSVITYKINTILEGYGETEENRVFEEVINLQGGFDSLDLSRMISDFGWVEFGSKHILKSVECSIKVTDVKPEYPDDIKAGDYVEYHYDFDNIDAFKVYKVVKDCTSADWLGSADLLASDYRDNVTFVLERTSYFDDNMIGNVDRNIKEALVNYIIWRWFEYVNVPEADKFYLKFEDYAHKAQLGMNSETKPIQRKYKLF